MSKKRIGFAGIGRMGTPMVRRLLDAGYEVGVFDVNKDAVASLEKAGSRIAASPAALMGMADIVLMSLPTPEIVQTVALGEEGLIKGKGARIVIDLSTTGPRVMRIVAAALQAAGITPVDCPVSGGVGGAEKGTLAIMVACSSAVLPEVLPVLEVLGKPTHIGEEPWMGQMLKVINNIISVTSLAIASEALVLGTKAGLDPKVMMDVINAGTGRTNATTDKIPKFVLTRSFDFGFAIGLSAKDLRLCLEESDAFGVPMVVGSAVRQLVNITKGRLGPDADLTEIIRPIEEWAGVEVIGKKPA
jgi:3-hydroxyisobutyrate dehydrogenase-like beta-hydroxyacid dehydrogenase